MSHRFRFIDEGYSSWHLLGGYFPECTLIPVDVQRARAWIMLLHAGYYSCARIVPDGCCSWAQILSGTVQWIFHRPRLDNPNRRDLHLATENYRLAYDTHGGHVSEMETFTVSGKPGTIMYALCSYIFLLDALIHITASFLLDPSMSCMLQLRLWSLVVISTLQTPCTSLK